MNIPVSDDLIINEQTLPVITRLAESIPGGFFIYRAGGAQELIYFNSRLPAIFGCDSDEEFRALTGNSFRGMVHPEDYDRSESSIKEQIERGGDNIDHIKYRIIRRDGSIGMLDDYGRFSRSETFGNIYYVFVQDITKEYLEEQAASRMELLNRTLTDYEGVFIIDCVNDTRRTFHDRLSGASYYDDAVSYSELFSKYAENFVCEPDREMMRAFAEPAAMLRATEDRKELTVNYRDRTTGTQRFYEMRIIRLSDTEVLQSFRESDAEMVNRLLFEKLKDNYFAILGVDLESGLARSYKQDPLHILGAEGEVSPLSSIMMRLASYYEGKPRRLIERYSSAENIKAAFAREDRAEYVFPSAQGEGTKWVAVTGIVFSRNDAGEPALFCITFHYLDERAAELRSLQERLGTALNEAKEANAVIAEQQRQAGRAEQARREQIAKTSGTESTYIVNTETESFFVLGRSEYLDENYPEDESYTQSIGRYIANDVFEPDRKRASEMLSLSEIIRRLENEEEYTVRYRDITAGRPRWYEMRAVRLSGTELLLGFSDNDGEIITQLMAENFRESYFGLYYINLDSGLAQIIKTGHPEITGEVGAAVPYSALTLSIADASNGEAAEFFRKISDIGYIKNRFAAEDFAYHVYRSYIFEGSRWVNYTGRVLQRHEDGTPALFALALSLLDEEATAKEEANLKLHEALERAESASRAKTDFLFNMSHDIRTPMNAILGFTGMAKKHMDSREKVSDYLGKIDSSGRQLLELINQVLEMSRIESGKTEFRESPVNISEQYNDMVTVLAAQARDRGLEFHHSLSDAVHLNVFADTAKMSSVTLNVTGNAMKYTPRGGRIDYDLREIAPRRPGFATYVFTVADTGIGMSAEFIKTMFEPFTREQNSTVSEIQGTGLGMSIVKKLLDRMGGDIEVSSEPGRGTRFDITIDFRINGETEKKAEEKKAGGFSFKGRKVLLVEDNELNREIAVEILGEEGLDTETAEDGLIAVERLREKGPGYYDFILMDIQMPVMNGYEATKAIRELYPDRHIPIIALSANAFEEDRTASRAAGMDGHVAKPIDINELFDTISRLLLSRADG